MELSGLAREVKELGELDTTTLTDDELSELMVELHQLRSALEAQHARVARAWDARRAWSADGARSGASWMATRTRACKGDYGSLLRLASKTRLMPQVDAAWEAGEITRDHVRRLAAASNPRTYTSFARDEAWLVHQARTLTFAEFCQAIDYWLLAADPDGAADDHDQRVDRRRVSLDQTLGGMYSGSILLDPVRGSIVATELRRLEQQLFEADWADAKQRFGRDPSTFELARTPDQRRADALVEMARRSATAQPGASTKPLFTLLLGADSFRHLSELADGTVIPPNALRDWLDDADLEALLFDALGQRAIKVSRARSFTGAVRRVIEVRDRSCQHRYCDTRAAQCQADHITPWSEGGLTSQDNGQLLCGHHNRLRNRERKPRDDPD
ncbi:MAG TPA: DUF222 domain-containing protein [Acidimicrobiales bacterium]|nr:DUF222 domain-containing protein [Acidimicrobiales bacterium]